MKWVDTAEEEEEKETQATILAVGDNKSHPSRSALSWKRDGHGGYSITDVWGDAASPLYTSPHTQENWL